MCLLNNYYCLTYDFSSSFSFFFRIMDLGLCFMAFPLMTGLVLLVCRLKKAYGLMIVGHGLPSSAACIRAEIGIEERAGFFRSSSDHSFFIKRSTRGMALHTPPPVTGLLVGPLFAISLSNMSRILLVEKVILGISSRRSLLWHSHMLTNSYLCNYANSYMFPYSL